MPNSSRSPASRRRQSCGLPTSAPSSTWSGQVKGVVILADLVLAILEKVEQRKEPKLHTASFQNMPEILPLASIFMPQAAGLAARPGMVSISPVSGTQKPAPADRRISRTDRVKSRGRP